MRKQLLPAAVRKVLCMTESLYERIYRITRMIPCGKVATYGQIAELSGILRGGHTVGFAMAACRDETVPCHRVVDRFGRTKSAFDTYSSGTQRALLESEGVGFLPDGRVNLSSFLWNGDPPRISVSEDSSVNHMVK